MPSKFLTVSFLSYLECETYSCTIKYGYWPSGPNYQDVGLMGCVFTNGPGDQGLIPGRLIPKIPKIVFNAAPLNTRHYKVRIKGKVE